MSRKVSWEITWKNDGSLVASRVQTTTPLQILQYISNSLFVIITALLYGLTRLHIKLVHMSMLLVQPEQTTESCKKNDVIVPAYFTYFSVVINSC